MKEMTNLFEIRQLNREIVLMKLLSHQHDKVFLFREPFGHQVIDQRNRTQTHDVADVFCTPLPFLLPNGAHGAAGNQQVPNRVLPVGMHQAVKALVSTSFIA